MNHSCDLKWFYHVIRDPDMKRKLRRWRTLFTLLVISVSVFVISLLVVVSVEDEIENMEYLSRRKIKPKIIIVEDEPIVTVPDNFTMVRYS